ncbi:MAG: diguanylate cyclase [Planctomycetota bacterium]
MKQVNPVRKTIGKNKDITQSHNHCEELSNGVNWTSEFPGAITVCDAKGTILYMNRKAVEVSQKYGGLKLIAKNVLDCHPGPARRKLALMLTTRKANVYTIEKKGIKKLIFQSPFYLKGKYKGFVELSLQIPFNMRHFVRGTNSANSGDALHKRG